MKTLLPSQAGVEEALLAFLLDFFGNPSRCTTLCQMIRPVSRSMQINDCVLDFSSAVARKIFLPCMMGEPWPRPGIGTDHRTFSVALNFKGGILEASAMPSCRIPRHCGQSSAFAEPAWTAGQATAIKINCFKRIRVNILLH